MRPSIALLTAVWSPPGPVCCRRQAALSEGTALPFVSMAAGACFWMLPFSHFLLMCCNVGAPRWRAACSRRPVSRPLALHRGHPWRRQAPRACRCLSAPIQAVQSRHATTLLQYHRRASDARLCQNFKPVLSVRHNSLALKRSCQTHPTFLPCRLCCSNAETPYQAHPSSRTADAEICISLWCRCCRLLPSQWAPSHLAMLAILQAELLRTLTCHCVMDVSCLKCCCLCRALAPAWRFQQRHRPGPYSPQLPLASHQVIIRTKKAVQNEGYWTK